MSLGEPVPVAQRPVLPGLMRYAAVGAVATAAHYGLLLILVERLAWDARPASGMAALFGAQIAYLGNRRFTFARSRADLQAMPRWRSWWRFQATAAVGALASMVLVAAALAWPVHYLVGQCLATVVVMLGTYLVNRQWSFAPSSTRA